MSSHLHAATRGPSTVAPTNGSQTVLETNSDPALPSATLRLRAEPLESQRVRWAEDVVDNEGMGKKSSKVCCIYHKPHEPGDSGSDSDTSNSDDDSDSEPDLSRARKAGGKKPRGRQNGHGHGRDGGKGKGEVRKPSPNAYERQPKISGKKDG